VGERNTLWNRKTSLKTSLILVYHFARALESYRIGTYGYLSTLADYINPTVIVAVVAVGKLETKTTPV